MKTSLPISLRITLTSVVVAGAIFSGVVTQLPKAFAQETVLPTAVTQSDASSLTAIPTRLGEGNSLLLQPGERRQVEVRILNTSNRTITISTTALDFIVGEDGSTPIPLEGQKAENNRWSLASWLVLTPTEQTLSPNETGIVNVLIEVPEDALPGGHYAMITHQPSFGGLEGTGNSAAAAISQKVGTLLYTVVDGPINEEAYVTDFRFPQFSEFGPVPYTFTVDNRSDVHITPQVGITIKNFFGKTVEIIQPEQKNVFPLSAREYTGSWDRIWGFGPYTAELTMSFGEQGKVVVTYAKFWLLPIRILLAILVVLLTLIAAGIAVRRHILHKRTDQSQRISELEQKLEQFEKDKLKKYEE